MTTEIEQQRLLIHNRHDVTMDLWIEPWGDRIQLAAQATYLVVGEGPKGGSFELDLLPDETAIYGWSGSLLTIYDEQQIRVWQSEVAVP